MFAVVGEHVFPFLRTLGGDDSTYAHHMKDARFTIPTPALLARVVDLIEHVPMEDRDTKGDIYEYMLGKIASAGQNGQFRTPRHIIRLMVEMTAPQSTDVVCDPASGTCGFLVAVGEYLRVHHPEIFRDARLREHFHHGLFHGFDFDNTMLRIGSMNLLLHGVENPDIVYRDSLAQDHAGEDEKYTLVLANPPFAGSLDYFGDLQTNSRYWPVKKLGELCEAAIDCPHSTPVYATRPTLHPCVRSSDIQGATLDFTAAKYVEPEEYQKRIARGRPRVGDVIYCREGARFGNAARVTDDTQLCLGQRMMLLRPRVDRATTELLWAFLSSRAAYRQATRVLDGSASPHVNVRDIVAFQVPVPPLPLQCKFAAQVSVVERLKAAQRASLAKLDALFASLQHRAFRGEL